MLLHKISDEAGIPVTAVVAIGSLVLCVGFFITCAVLFWLRERRRVKWFDQTLAEERETLGRVKIAIEAIAAKRVQDTESNARRRVSELEDAISKNRKIAEELIEGARRDARTARAREKTAMAACPFCKAPTQPHAAFCGRCGANRQEVVA